MADGNIYIRTLNLVLCRARHARRAFFMRECYVCTRRREMEDAMPARKSPAPKSQAAAISVRPSRELLERLDRWIATQENAVSRSEAVLRLAEMGLNNAGVSSKAEEPSRGAEQAAGMAGDMIDHLADRSATREDREQRKRRLVKGPSEFREIRKQHGDARRKT